MSIYKSNLWFSDLDKTLSIIPDLSKLNGCSVLITGSTGLICSALIDLLIRYNDTCGGNIEIFASGRNDTVAKTRFGGFFERDYFHFLKYDALETFDLTDNVDYIIHGAGISDPHEISLKPAETLLTNLLGLYKLLDYIKEHNTRRLLYISSSEVYGKNTGSQPLLEDEYGYIDILNPRNSYSLGKCAAETLCISYADEYDADIVIARPGHIYGPTAKKTDSHVSSSFAFSAAEGRTIVMKSDGSQIRSYVYCLDCATALITLLLKGSSSQAYNISNPSSVISIYEMAKILSKAGNVDLKTEPSTRSEQRSFNPMNNSSLDDSKLSALGWRALFDAKTGFSHTVQILIDANKTY